jgi:hypothetical protein
MERMITRITILRLTTMRKTTMKMPTPLPTEAVLAPDV